MTRWTRIRVAPLLGALAVAVGAPTDASGQSLHLAELFAEQGRMADARAEVLAWFEIRGADATAGELQHGLFLRGRLSDDPASGMRDLERLVAEHPGGPFTARALTWMGAFRADRGEMQNAAALFTRVVREHPESESAEAARQWLSAQGIAVEPPVATPQPPMAAAPVSADSMPAVVDSLPVVVDSMPAVVDSTPVTPATAAAPDSVPAGAPAAPAPDSVSVEAPVAPTPDSVPAEAPAAPAPDSVPVEAPVAPTPDSATTREAAADSVAVPVVRDTVVAPVPAAAPDTTPATRAAEAPRTEPAPAAPPVERIPHGPPVPGAATGGAWAIQIGAFRNAEGARGLVAELVAAGFDARLVQVPLNDLLRVRIGRFAGQDPAQAVLERVRAAGYDGTLVNDARVETVVR